MATAPAIYYVPGAPGDGGVVKIAVDRENNCFFREDGKCEKDNHIHAYYEYTRKDAAAAAADPAAEVVPVALVVKKAMELAKEHDWCDVVEKGLKELGIDPHKYVDVSDLILHLRIPGESIKRYTPGVVEPRRNPLITYGGELFIANFKEIIEKATTSEILEWVEEVGEVAGEEVS